MVGPGMNRVWSRTLVPLPPARWCAAATATAGATAADCFVAAAVIAAASALLLLPPQSPPPRTPPPLPQTLRPPPTTTATTVGIALLATAIILNWELGLVMLACVPFIGASVAILSKLMSSSSQEGADYYGKAGGVATEVHGGGVFLFFFTYY